MKRSEIIARIVVCIAALIIMGCLATDLVGFVHLRATCQTTNQYCSGLPGIKCEMLVSDCPRYSFFAENQVTLSIIGVPDVESSTLFDYIGWIVLIVYALVANCFLYVGYVALQPFIFNPPLWLAVGVGVRWMFTAEKQAINPMLSVVENQRAMGDAGPATPAAIHRALVGGGSLNVNDFED